MKNKRLLEIILMSFAVLLGLASFIVAAIYYKGCNGYELIYLIGIVLSLALLIWSKRVPMHAVAALFISSLGLMVKFINWGINYSASHETIAIVASIINFVIAFLAFDSMVFSAHTLFKVYKWKKIVYAFNFALAALIVALVVINLVIELKGFDTTNQLALLNLIFENAELLSCVAVPVVGCLVVAQRVQ